MPTFIERHASKIRGVLSCFDRVVLTGTLPDLCQADAIARYLGAREIRLFDYPRFAEPFREELHTHAERLAGAHGLMIDFIRHWTFRKEDRITQRLADRGDHPDLVHIFSAMESVGSTITQQLLLEYPQRVNKAIIFATSPDGRDVALTAKGKTPDDPSVLRQTEATIHWKPPLDNQPRITNQVMIVVGTSDTVMGVGKFKDANVPTKTSRSAPRLVG